MGMEKVHCSIQKEGNDSSYSKTTDGKIFKFSPLVKRGTKVEVSQEFDLDYYHGPSLFNIQLYRIPEYNAEYCDTPGMELVETIQIEFPDAHLGLNRPLTFGISFGCICKEFNKWTNVCNYYIWSK
ncbi:unnamed protein product [Rhizophagus irregularis]|nr:unnamed protein product [Rhizophagus irregularis]